MKPNLPPLPMPPKPPKYFDWARINGTINIILTVVLTVGLSISMAKIISYGDNCEKVVNYGMSSRLYGAVKDKQVIENTIIAGLYSPNSGIFCVNGDNFTKEQDTVCHEYCHYLIDKKKCLEDGETITCRKHFCEG